MKVLMIITMIYAADFGKPPREVYRGISDQEVCFLMRDLMRQKAAQSYKDLHFVQVIQCEEIRAI